MKRRQFLAITATASAAFLASYNLFKSSLAFGQPASQRKAQLKPTLGVNLAAISYWNSELPFTDMMKLSGEWVSNSRRGKWADGPKLALDDSGWVRFLEAGCQAARMLSLEGLYPIGEYTVLYEGEGEFEFLFNVATVVARSPGKVTFRVSKRNAALTINLTKVNPDNYLRNIQVLLPGYESSSDGLWSKSLLNRWSGVTCIRFMDLMATNNSMQTSWSDRPKIADCSYAVKGVPIEAMVNLANTMNCDAWFCIPHLADDDYIKQFLKYINDNLNSGLRAWIEYSNEVWNRSFPQSKYASERGIKSGLSKNPAEACWYAYAQRCIEVFKIVDCVDFQHKRFVRVVASQAANPFVAEKILGYRDLAKYADVLAIAPYLSLLVTPAATSGTLSESEVSHWTIDKLFSYLNSTVLPETVKWIQSNSSVAERYGIKLVAYEAGQHLVGVYGAENNKSLLELFNSANADARMGQLYTNYLKEWAQYGDLLCAFNSVSVWAKWGSWGLLQKWDDDLQKSYKYKAVIEWAKSKGQAM